MFFCSSTICAVGQNIINIINGVLVPVLFALSFIVFLYGIAKAYIFSGGDTEKVGAGHKLLMWGIIGFVVMVSLWGMVNVVANTFGLGGAYAPLTPSSVPFGGYTTTGTTGGTTGTTGTTGGATGGTTGGTTGGSYSGTACTSDVDCFAGRICVSGSCELTGF